MTKNKIIFSDDMDRLIKRNGYTGYSEYLSGNIDEKLFECLGEFVSLITNGFDSSQLKKIRKKYMEDIER